MGNYHNLKLLCGSNMLRGGKLEVFLLYALIYFSLDNTIISSIVLVISEFFYS